VSNGNCLQFFCRTLITSSCIPSEGLPNLFAVRITEPNSHKYLIMEESRNAVRCCQPLGATSPHLLIFPILPSSPWGKQLRLAFIAISILETGLWPPVDHSRDLLSMWMSSPVFQISRMPSSGMLRRVNLVRTDVSEERITSVIWVTRIDELGTTLAVTKNRRTLQINCVSS
jgi:hypothetical protein